jgi:hypothetical protein
MIPLASKACQRRKIRIFAPRRQLSTAKSAPSDSPLSERAQTAAMRIITRLPVGASCLFSADDFKTSPHHHEDGVGLRRTRYATKAVCRVPESSRHDQSRQRVFVTRPSYEERFSWRALPTARFNQRSNAGAKPAERSINVVARFGRHLPTLPTGLFADRLQNAGGKQGRLPLE